MSDHGKVIVITGANSGIGFEACKALATTKGTVYTIVLACRSIKKAQDAVGRIRAGIPVECSETGTKLIPAACDLESLDSIKAFAEHLPALVDNAQLDVVCLNAGLARKSGASDVIRTTDGFELTGKIGDTIQVFLSFLFLTFPILHELFVFQLELTILDIST
jgi:NAD(P)-dependent dehydrogenase (short-subunit alcohol dehydrogenase family)